MKYQRTQVYLDPDDHRKLREEAQRRGISLAAVLREIAGAHVRESSAPYRTEKSWDALIGICGEGEPSDIARYEDEYKRDMWLAKAREVEAQIDKALGSPKKLGSSRKKPRTPR